MQLAKYKNVVMHVVGMKQNNNSMIGMQTLRNTKRAKEANALHSLYAWFPTEQVAFTIVIVQVDWLGNIISPISRSDAINRIHIVYPILCHITSSGPNILSHRLACSINLYPRQITRDWNIILPLGAEIPLFCRVILVWMTPEEPPQQPLKFYLSQIYSS